MAIRSASCGCRAPRSSCRPTRRRTPMWCTRQRSAISIASADEAPLVVEEMPSLYFYKLRMGDARADGAGGLLLGRRVRSRRHQEARAHAEGQGRRSHAAHVRATGADRAGVPDVSGVERGRCRGSARGRQPRRSSTSRRRMACSTRSGVWLRAERADAGRGVPRDSPALHRRRTSPRRQRDARAAGAARSGARQPHLSRPTRSWRSRFPATRRRSCHTTAS